MKIACIGGAHIDRYGVLKGPLAPATSNPGAVTVNFGGVARNVTENLVRLGCDVLPLSRVGRDESGRAVVAHLRSLGLDTSLITGSSTSTASYIAILEPDGELVLGLADMDIYDEITPDLLEPMLPRLRECSLWFLDANLPEETIQWLARFDVDLAADAICIAKSRRLWKVLDRVGVLFLDVAQAASLIGAPGLADARSAARAMRAVGAGAGIVTDGMGGIVVWADHEISPLPALPAVPRNVTGVGDALIAGTLYGLTGLEGIVQAARLGLAAAAITVESESTVAQNLSPQLMYERLSASRA